MPVGSITNYYSIAFLQSFIGLFLFAFILHLLTIKKNTKENTTWFDRFKSASTSGMVCFLLHLMLSTVLPLGFSIAISVVMGAVASNKVLKLLEERGTMIIAENTKGKENAPSTSPDSDV